MIKEFILKENPLHKITLTKSEFKIINLQYKDEGGVFLYSKLYDIEFKEKSPDYFSSVIVIIFNFLLPGRIKERRSFKERIRMNYNGKERIITLTDFNKKNTIEAVIEIQKRMDKKYQ